MLTVPHIQALPGWSLVNNSTIGPWPEAIEITPVPANPAWMPPGLLLDITGTAGKYADGVARSPDIQMPANTGNAVLTVQFAVNEAALTDTQAIEMGFKYTTPAGITLNGQFQFDWGKSAADMILDLTSTTGSGWTPTPTTLPKFAPIAIHTVAAKYLFTATWIGISSVAIDGVVYQTPAAMLGCPGKSLGWAKNAFQVNIQPNTNPTGGEWSLLLLDVNMQVS